MNSHIDQEDLTVKYASVVFNNKPSDSLWSRFKMNIAVMSMSRCIPASICVDLYVLVLVLVYVLIKILFKIAVETNIIKFHYCVIYPSHQLLQRTVQHRNNMIVHGRAERFNLNVDLG